MKDLIPILTNNIIMIFSFMIILILSRLSDIFLGAVLAYKDITLTFDYKKIVKGFIYSLICGIALVLLTVAISLLPEFLTLYNITMIDNDILKEVTNLSIIAIIITASLKRMKDCKDKFQKIANVENGEEIELQIIDGRD